MKPVPKHKRIVDRALLDSYHGKSCEVCRTTYQTVAHHIQTKGAGGDDVPDNLATLCHTHHTEIHQIGPTRFRAKYPHLLLSNKKKWT